MPAPVPDVSTYGDFAGLAALRRSAGSHNPAAVREVAKQFEALFARMMIKSMRDAIGRDPIFGSDQSEAYQSMFDDQLSIELTRGHGLGLADMLVRQLQKLGVTGAGSASGTLGAKKAAGMALKPAGTGAGMPLRAPSPAGARSLAPATAVERKRFIGQLWPQAERAGAALGVSPAGLVAQAALETDWGRSVPRTEGGQSSNNLFGVKAGASWSGPAVTAPTWEVENGAATGTSGEFRAYPSSAQSFEDYVALLKTTPRYAAALNTGGDVRAFATALQRGGYATDPDYAHKVSAIASHVTATVAQNAAGGSPLVASTGGPLKFADVPPITGDTGTLL
ncbi:MAG TPA: flagellar assembly peptidoglycan hydrolase FlgJ [Steroidobacteraceae bacterium]|nr:flagellar assembly peptidoglycan hydrolase FlgJ [Steroidobacteraceae bacterium]